MKKIGILGSGDVGKTLAIGFIKHGHEAMIGTRNTSKLNEWIRIEGPKAKSGSFEETAAFGDVLVLACKGSAAMDVLKAAGSKNLEGKTIIDATNPIADAPPENGVLKFFTDLDFSLMEKLQESQPGARFVKAFNSIGSSHMVNPNFKGVRPTMFICGNSEEAKKEVKLILDKFDFETVDMGKAESARAIEPLCMLWCIPGFLRNEWNHGFKLLNG